MSILVITEPKILHDSVFIDNRSFLDRVFNRPIPIQRLELSKVQRAELSEMLIAASDWEIGNKYDFETDKCLYFGVTPLEAINVIRNRTTYRCCIEYWKEK